MFIPNSELLVVDSLQGKRQRDEWSIINADYVLPVIFVQTAVQKCLKLQSSYDPGLTMLSSIFFLFVICKFSFIRLHVNCSLLQLPVVGGAMEFSSS